jgi:isoleucyl-tRNA synthetase
VTYANIDRVDPRIDIVPVEERSLLDCWILAELHLLVRNVTEALEDCDSESATHYFEAFFEKLSNWWVRRSRRRFWKGEAGKDKRAAHQTLYECLLTVAKLLAPFLPFLAEELYQNLVRSLDKEAPESVHHCDWPEADPELIDEQLLSWVAVVRTVVGLGRAARNAAGIKIRQPLSELLIKLPHKEDEEPLRALGQDLLEEVNVKGFAFVEDEAEVVDYRLHPLPEKLGPKYGERFAAVREALEELDPREAARELAQGGALRIRIDNRSYTILADEVEVERLPREGYAIAVEDEYLVALNTEITPELKMEGLARELVRHIQEMRKEADLNLTDRIVTCYEGGEAIKDVLHIHADYIKRETLSLELVEGELKGEKDVKTLTLNGNEVHLYIEKVS